MKTFITRYKKLSVLLLLVAIILGTGSVPLGIVSAASPSASPSSDCAAPDDSKGTCGHQCGKGDDAYTPAIDLGCKGQGNPILDMTFGIIHFLSDGVGLVVIGSIIVGGIQYTGSRGDPQSTAMAVNRIRSSVFALILFIFAYAIINYIIPGFAL
jgi:hypothetical protein